MKLSKPNRIILIMGFCAFLISLGYHGFKAVKSYPDLERVRRMLDQPSPATSSVLNAAIKVLYGQVNYHLFRLKLETLAIAAIGAIAIILANWPKQRG